MTSVIESTRRTRTTALTELQVRVFQEACATRPHNQLMTWVLDRRNLEAAWEHVRESDGADTPGSDGVRAEELRRQMPGWLARLAEDLFACTYQPAPLRWVEIPRPNQPGRTRRLGLLTLRDRVVLTALKQVLEPVLDPLFLPSSFGFRPGRSVPGALAEALRLLRPRDGKTAPLNWAVHLDVADCFDTVAQDLLLVELQRHTADSELLRLLQAFLRVGATTTTSWWLRRYQVGLVQGSPLSPMLCNLALHPLDVALRELSESCQGAFAALRYADDLLVLARDEALVARGVTRVRRTLAHLRQKLRDERPRPVPLTQGVEWLGVRVRQQPTSWDGRVRFGYVVPDDRVRGLLARVAEITAPPSERIDAAAFNLARWIVSINTQLREWRQAYRFADNVGEVFTVVDEQVFDRVGELLRAVTGCSRMGLRRRFLGRLPRGFRTWQVQGAQLTVLSALAPERPWYLTRRPSWMRPAPLEAEETPPEAATQAEAGSTESSPVDPAAE